MVLVTSNDTASFNRMVVHVSMTRAALPATCCSNRDACRSPVTVRTETAISRQWASSGFNYSLFPLFLRSKLVRLFRPQQPLQTALAAAFAEK